MTSRERRAARKWRRRFRNTDRLRRLQIGRRIQGIYPSVPISLAVEVATRLEEEIVRRMEHEILCGRQEPETARKLLPDSIDWSDPFGANSG